MKSSCNFYLSSHAVISEDLGTDSHPDSHPHVVPILLSRSTEINSVSMDYAWGGFLVNSKIISSNIISGNVHFIVGF